MRQLWTATLFCSLLAACKTASDTPRPKDPEPTLVGATLEELVTVKGRPVRTHNPKPGIQVYEYVETNVTLDDGTPVTYSTLYQQEGDFNRSQCLALFEIKEGVVSKVTRQGAGCESDGT